MKKKMFYLAAALFSISFFSCQDESDSVADSGLPAKLELTLQGTSTSVTPAAAIPARSHGVLPSGTGTIGSDEGTINRITVGVFKTSGATDVIYETTSIGSDFKLKINATEGAREILVVANAPAGHFAGIMTKAAFLGQLVSLDVTTPGDAGLMSQLTTKLPMSGQATTVSGGTDTNISLAQGSTASAFVSLTRLVSRISISQVTSDFEPTGLYPNATFTPTGLFLYNAKTKSTWDVGTTLPTTSVLKQGESSTSGSSDYLPYLGETVSDFTTPYYFYTFANYDVNFPTKLIIKGTFDVDGDGVVEAADGDGTVYYPIVINKSQAGTTLTGGSGNSTIDRNKTFALAATIKSKGVTSPSDDIEPADVSLTVEVTAWAVDIIQSVVFQ